MVRTGSTRPWSGAEPPDAWGNRRDHHIVAARAVGQDRGSCLVPAITDLQLGRLPPPASAWLDSCLIPIHLPTLLRTPLAAMSRGRAGMDRLHATRPCSAAQSLASATEWSRTPGRYIALAGRQAGATTLSRSVARMPGQRGHSGSGRPFFLPATAYNNQSTNHHHHHQATLFHLWD